MNPAKPAPEETDGRETVTDQGKTGIMTMDADLMRSAGQQLRILKDIE